MDDYPKTTTPDIFVEERPFISRAQRRFLVDAARRGARSSGCTCQSPFPKVDTVTPEYVDLVHSRLCVEKGDYGKGTEVADA